MTSPEAPSMSASTATAPDVLYDGTRGDPGRGPQVTFVMAGCLGHHPVAGQLAVGELEHVAAAHQNGTCWLRRDRGAMPDRMRQNSTSSRS
jgi:hypothetical protein